ncbi:MAG: xanthine dehydrogenase family protein subunit M [Aromatoleum sp.]|jgi:carbon-monoxide dehydrogenase medium subunit|uniref:FAD binding domain-containing protein n=1 Tax=Aromatoleum sp. TaxID=2307007 RepID=UPI0028961F3C|nr:xanthine dehydrogenase family protein subunit M [Aromatoleum sp.]MDT3671840.1 xanthine dehydrogenase family protein subunit M [Aromatoleum sp.]
MSLPKFTYVAPASLDEAVTLAADLGDKCVFIAGGTDILVAMKDRVITPEWVIDLKGIPGMDELSYIPGEGLKVGALAKLRAIETSEIVLEKYLAVADAAHSMACRQIRAKGTMAGNLCNASPCADMTPILLALNASVKTFRKHPECGRTIPLQDFFIGLKKTALTRDEIVTQIEIPEPGPRECAAYVKHTFRKAMDIGIVGAAAWLKMDGETCVDCRIALGGAGPTAIRAYGAEALLVGQRLTGALIDEVGVRAAECCSPRRDVGPRRYHRVHPEYRKDMIRVFTVRSIRRALERRGI